MFKILVNGLRIKVQDNQTLLSAVTQSGFTVPFSCRSGRCNECLAKIKLPNSFSKTILSCEHLPSNGDVYEFADFEDFALPKIMKIPAKIDRIESVALNYKIITFRIPPGKNISYLPGQYFDITVPKFGTRSYSVYSSKNIEQKLQILVQYVAGGELSNYWFNNACEDELVYLEGPIGSFFLRNNDTNVKVFCGTGSGIAPLRSMILSDRERSVNCTALFWSVKALNEHFNIFRDVVTRPSCELHTHLTREFYPGFTHGRITPEIIKYLKSSLLKVDSSRAVDVYACGNGDFTDDLRSRISALESDQINLYIERFTENNL